MSEHRLPGHKPISVPLPDRPLTNEEDNELTWRWVMMQLMDEQRDILGVLEELRADGCPDWTAALSMWQLQFSGMQLAAAGSCDEMQRSKIKAVLAERKKAMLSILARVRRGRRKEKKANGRAIN
jgi:hypothetical protein